MKHATTKNFHVPLPARLYDALQAEASRQKRPATQLAREAIVRSLVEHRKQRAEQELREYVAAVAGSKDDLDPNLESVAARYLLEETRWK
jgi:hypothetical protein